MIPYIILNAVVQYWDFALTSYVPKEKESNAVAL